MLFDKHGNGNGLDDLYILPQTHQERLLITKWLYEHDRAWSWEQSDVEGHDWLGKRFICIPFGEALRDEIRQYTNG